MAFQLQKCCCHLAEGAVLSHAIQDLFSLAVDAGLRVLTCRCWQL